MTCCTRPVHNPSPSGCCSCLPVWSCPTTPPPPSASALRPGKGGALVPLMCVDKRPEEIASFQALAEESGQFGHDWAMVFVAALSGTLDKLPTSEEAEAPLQRMVDAIKQGAHSAFIPFNRQGEPVRFG